MEPRAVSVEVRLLGPVELRIDGGDVLVGGPRQRALLSLLALRPGKVVPVDALIEELWAGEPTDGADTTLRSYVSRLRKSLDGTAAIEHTDGGYALQVPPDAVDALAFERLLREGGDLLARGAARRARERLAAGLGLWRGRPFGEVGTEGTLGAMTRRLDELRLLAIERRIEAELALGAAADLVDELEGLLLDYPYRERLWRHLMLALYRAGRQSDALAAYHRARSMLDEHLGIEPGDDLRELEGAILRQDVPEVARADARVGLPIALTSFIGRATEIEEVERLVRRHRLVTLTGIGGVGKTRLALEVARRAADLFPDGVWFVDLAPLSDPDLVAASVADVLAVRGDPSVPTVDGMVAQLGNRELLVVIDNCEHLRDACAELAAALLEGAPDLHVLATSRVTLGVAGEIDYAVPPLALPRDAEDASVASTSDAVGLFVERARAARPTLPEDQATLATVARIVADLDGLPLAIELAAARAKAFTLADIAAGLNDRFRFLVSWRRLSPARHRTLAEAMAWSFDLLGPEHQALLSDLSVFARSADIEAIAAVCLDGDQARARDLLQLLVDASLVMLETGPDGGSRYRLLETVREYAMERQAGGDRRAAMRRAHADHFALLAESTPTRGPDAAQGIARLDAELDNIRAALDAAVDLGDRGLQRWLTASMWRYWQIRGFLAEGRARLVATLAHGPDVAPEHYPNALLGAGFIAWAMGEYEDGTRYGAELLALAEASGSATLENAGHRVLASIALRERDFETSERHSLRVVELSRQLGEPINAAIAEMNHAVLLMDWGRMEPAVAQLHAVLERFRALAHGEGIGLTLLNLGEAAFLLGNADDAHRRFVEARDAFASVGFRAHVGHATQGLAAVAAREGDAALAADLLGRAGAILAEVGASADDFNPAMVAGAIERANAALGPEAYAAAFDAGWSRQRRALRAS